VSRRLAPEEPGVEEVRRIAAIVDPVLRNLEITQCYAELAAAVTTRVGEGANWCTYATWASRQAGRSIRGEDMLEHAGRALGESRWVLHPLKTLWRRLLRRGLLRPGTRLGRLSAEVHTPFDAVERASEAVARGNLKVFEEIGLEFARYLHDCEPGDDDALRRFLDELRPGGPPDGQDFLRQAFAHYERARLEPDPSGRAQLVVLANLEIGLHEQTRLQPEIRAALDAPFVTQERLGLGVLTALFPSSIRLWAIVRRPAAAAAGAVAKRVQRASTAVAREVVTDAFMTLSLPGRTLALGTHLVDELPDWLREPTDPELAQLLAGYEPVPPALDDCGARDWSELDQRMHYISHLFRAFHLSANLARAPFTAEQVARLRDGHLPEGEL
jgi:hypothetical protein